MTEVNLEGRDEPQYPDETPQPNLGCATTKELLDEIRARIEKDGKLYYRTVDEPF